jgi:aryl-alcohol dehydrogenase-like predicted oxidoreductase
VSSVIPGARNLEQARSNAAAGLVPPLGPAFEAGVGRIYDTHLRAEIHPRW